MSRSTEKDNWRSDRSVVYKNTVHLVFVTKYRRKVFTRDIMEVVKNTIAKTCLQMECELL